MSEPKILARYVFPVGANVASLVVQGSELAVEDFDALLEYVALFRSQFNRAPAGEKADLVPTKEGQ